MKVASFSYQGHYPGFKSDVLALTDIINAYFKTKVSVDFYTDQKKQVDDATHLLTEAFFTKTVKNYKAIITDQLIVSSDRHSSGYRYRLLHAMPYDLVVRPVIMYHESTSSLKGIQVPDVRMYICRETRIRPVSLARDTHFPKRDFEVISDPWIYATAFMKEVLSVFMDLAKKKHAEDVTLVLPVTIKSPIFKKWTILFEEYAETYNMPSLIVNVSEFWKTCVETPKKIRWIFAPDPFGDYLFNSLNTLLNKDFFSCYALVTGDNKFYIENNSDSYKGVQEYRSPLNYYHSLAMMYDLMDMVIPARVLRRGIYEAMDKGWLTLEMGGTMNASAVSGLYGSYVDRELSETSRSG